MEIASYLLPTIAGLISKIASEGRAEPSSKEDSIGTSGHVQNADGN